jgi:lambda repressor-like predicted transcriptional regulator
MPKISPEKEKLIKELLEQGHNLEDTAKKSGSSYRTVKSIFNRSVNPKSPKFTDKEIEKKISSFKERLLSDEWGTSVEFYNEALVMLYKRILEGGGTIAELNFCVTGIREFKQKYGSILRKESLESLPDIVDRANLIISQMESFLKNE